MQARSHRFLPCQYSLSFVFYFVESQSHSYLRFLMIQLDFHRVISSNIRSVEA